jgi:hypothetical protein
MLTHLTGFFSSLSTKLFNVYLLIKNFTIANCRYLGELSHRIDGFMWSIFYNGGLFFQQDLIDRSPRHLLFS